MRFWIELLSSPSASPAATLACETLRETDFRKGLPACTIPTLFIHGTSDKTVPIDASDRAAARGIAGAKLIEHDGKPHGPFATAPAKLNADLISFVGWAVRAGLALSVESVLLQRRFMN